MGWSRYNGAEPISGRATSMTDDIGTNEKEILSEFLGVVRLSLYVLAAVGGAGLSASHFGLG